MNSRDNKLIEFMVNLQQEILGSIDIEGQESFREDRFTEIMIDYLSDMGEVDDGSVCNYRARGMQVNGYSISEDNDCLTLFVSNFSSQTQPENIPSKDVEDASNRARNFVKKSLDGLYRELEEASSVFDLARSIYDIKETLTMLRIFYLTDGIVKKFKIPDDNSLSKVDVTHQIWDIERLHRAVTSGKRRELIEIDIEKLFGNPIPSIVVNPAEADTYTTYLAVIPGRILIELYNLYGPRLLERNVRSFLQARGKVNSGIRNTILNEPEMFLAYNNGISAIAEEVRTKDLKDGQKGITWLKDFQIVNGAQTTASLYHASKKERIDVESIFVQVKLTVISDSKKADEIVPLISEYANSQNKIQTADFSANDPFHRTLEELSRTIWAPPVNGAQRQTKWYYERARGQYADDKEREGTPARKRNFEIMNPPYQKFTKTDLAKFENSWNMLPHIVSRGAQMNFREFTIQLKTDYKDFLPNETYFKHLMAKAILFKTADKLIQEQEYGGYKANLVTYTIAKLAYATEQRIDLDQIWTKQEISEALKYDIIETSKKAFAHITNTPVENTNVTQWCKRKECWFSFKNTSMVPSQALIKELKDDVQMKKAEEEVKYQAETLTTEQLARIEKVKQIDSMLWLKIAAWSKETNKLQSWQRENVMKMSNLIRRKRTPTLKQAEDALKILQDARYFGFNFEHIKY